MGRLHRAAEAVIPLYCGFDKREAVGFHAFVASVMDRTNDVVSFIPIGSGQRDGSNAFTYSRFLVPQMQGFEGWAIFADGSDMVCLADIADLWALRDESCAVMCVQHEYQTRNPVKYIGTGMECANRDYPRKNWSSLMLMNCGHPRWRSINDRSLPYMSGAELHRFAWLLDADIGALPPQWNVLVDEGQEAKGAKLLHWTAGIPAFDHYHRAPKADVWFAEARKATNAG